MKSSFFEHFYALTGPKYAEKYEDSESGLKSKHSLAKTTKKHDFRGNCWKFVGHFFGKPFWGHWWGAYPTDVLNYPQRGQRRHLKR